MAACARTHQAIFASPAPVVTSIERSSSGSTGSNWGVLYRAGADAEGGHALLMLGWSQAAWHLELVGDSNGETPPSSTDEDLLVLYVGGSIDEEVVGRLVRAGGQQVAARNPYWDRCGVTIVDPDGYHLVLSHRSWP